MDIRFKQKGKIIDVAIVCLGVLVSVGTMLYGVFHFGLTNTWPELVLNLFYIACLVMIVMYFFQKGITTNQFNYWCSLCVGATILLRDILFPPQLDSYPIIHMASLTLSVMLILMLTYFYARKEWETYSKLNLWMICIIDMVIAALYTYVTLHEPADEYTDYMLTEIWIRPTITYGLVACFVSKTEESVHEH
jgi:hypothetical protein